MTIHTGSRSAAMRRQLTVGEVTYTCFSIDAAQEAGLGDFDKLPACLRIVVENLSRFLDEESVLSEDIEALSKWVADGGRSEREIAFRPGRVLMQDFTGVPAVADLAAMRDAMGALGGDPQRINPQTPVDLIIDHSVSVDEFAHPQAFERNVAKEYERNEERYRFLKWGQQAFANFSVAPPGTGICHQVNLERLAQTVWVDEDERGGLVAFPDTLVGADSHTTMINALGVLGWGVGGIEAEAAMLGQPISMKIPQVVGVELQGSLQQGITATDLVLRIVQMLREHGVVGRFVEFHGAGLDHLSLGTRATIANMAPEYGATCGFFPIDDETLRYLAITGRAQSRIELVKAYAQHNGLWRGIDYAPIYTSSLQLDLNSVEPSIAGPKRPQDRVPLASAANAFQSVARAHRATAAGRDQTKERQAGGGAREAEGVPDDRGEKVTPDSRWVPVDDFWLHDGSIVIAAITSCTNTSNPLVMIAAGLLARKANQRGLRPKPWVKTSLAPGSRVVTDYLQESELSRDLDALGFNLVGYGCTTCIGNSGPLPEQISTAIREGDLVAVSVLSGNRNFAGRINTDVRANYLASPPLVVAYALVGDMNCDITRESLGKDHAGDDVYLKDIWPDDHEIQQVIDQTIDRTMFESRYAEILEGDDIWRSIEVTQSDTYDWPSASTYIKRPPYFDAMTMDPPGVQDILGARLLLILGDSVTTDHISPAGTFARDTPAGKYLSERQVSAHDFNSYGARRGNHEVMVRGTFANVRIRNEMVSGREGGYTLNPDGQPVSIFEASMAYESLGTPLVVVAGKEYGTGSSRDWAAKGPLLLGVKVVIAESYERIHRSNLVGMGVLPLEFEDGVSRKTLALMGTETIDLEDLESALAPGGTVAATITREDGTVETIDLKCRIDTVVELEYIHHGGVLPYVVRRLASQA